MSLIDGYPMNMTKPRQRQEFGLRIKIQEQAATKYENKEVTR